MSYVLVWATHVLIQAEDQKQVKATDQIMLVQAQLLVRANIYSLNSLAFQIQWLMLSCILFGSFEQAFFKPSLMSLN